MNRVIGSSCFFPVWGVGENFELSTVNRVGGRHLAGGGDLRWAQPWDAELGEFLHEPQLERPSGVEP